MSNVSVNNKRIAKNTLFLYFRTILIMLVTLYTSRVVLNTLGVEDYGIFSAVGGVVSVFTVLSGALTNAISRYITYSIGNGNVRQLNNVFCTSVNIQILLAIIIFVLCELVGVWFLNNKMTIPPERMIAANWVLHFSLLTFVVNLISVPYNACIIAHEHMIAYAYISIIDAILKLGVAYMLIVSPFDKLSIYGLLLFFSALAVRIFYGIYCKKHFEECKYRYVKDKGLFKEMLGFAGWNFFGNAAAVLNTQGINLLINVFFGVVANSARGIASQVDAAVNQFVVTFSTAVNPQITKSFAQGDLCRMNYLVCKGAKFSYFLLLIIAVPLIFEAESVLSVWLGTVPDGAALFLKLSLIGAMVNVLGNSGYTACIASGKIRKYSIVITLIGSLNFILTWIAYKMGATVETTYIIYIAVYAVLQIERLVLMKELLNFPIMMFVREVIFKILIPTIVALIVPYLMCRYVDTSIWRIFLVSTTSAAWSCFCIFYLGLTTGERITIKAKMRSVVCKLISR